MPKFTVKQFRCDDGDMWYSVIVDGDELATCVMHDTRAAAEAEARALRRQ